MEGECRVVEGVDLAWVYGCHGGELQFVGDDLPWVGWNYARRYGVVNTERVEVDMKDSRLRDQCRVAGYLATR